MCIISLESDPSEVQAKREAPPPQRKGTSGKPRRHPAPLMPRFDEIIMELPEEAWETVTWREDSKGPMRGQFAALRMHRGKGNQTRSLDDHRTTTSEEGWLIAERLRSGEGETKYYFTGLPARTSLKQPAAAVKSRWPIRGSSTKTRGSIAASATSRVAAGTAYTARARAGDALLQLPRTHPLAGRIAVRSTDAAGGASPSSAGAADRLGRAVGADEASGRTVRAPARPSAASEGKPFANKVVLASHP